MTARQRLQLWKKRYATWDNLWRVLLVIGMLILAARGLYLGWSYPENVIRSWSYWHYSLVNLGPELAGIVIGVVFIDVLNERRQTQQLKAQLIRQMGSPIRDVAVPAVRELAHHGWVFDGSLNGALLTGAGLKGADLHDAQLEGADMQEACLEGACLSEANLAGACLNMAHLERVDMLRTQLGRASLYKARLENAYLEKAQLNEADLVKADFKEAVLNEASLERANLENANLFRAKLMKAQLTGADMNGAILVEADLMDANLERANCRNANLEGASMKHVNLNNTDLQDGNLSGVRNLTSSQLRAAATTQHATMPDGTMLRDVGGVFPYLEGPTLEEWLATKPDCLVWENEEE